MNIVSYKIYNKVANLALKEGLSQSLIQHHNAILNQETSKLFVPFHLLLDIYELGHKNLEPGFAVRVGKNMLPEDYGTLGLSWKTAWKAKEVFERTIRFNILITDVGGFKYNVVNDKTIVLLDRPILRLGQALSNEATLALSLNIIRVITGKNINPTFVSFIHTGSSDISNYTNFFNCDVKFSQKENSIHFLSKDIDVPTIKVDKSINAFLLERLEEEKKGIEKQPDKFILDITSLVKDALSSGIPSLQSISQLLAMSNRTLTRRLSKAGFTFRDIVKTTQLNLAKEMLANPIKSVGEIAFLTGFSEQSAFNRAFKKWTNQTPLDFRKNL